MNADKNSDRNSEHHSHQHIVSHDLGVVSFGLALGVTFAIFAFWLGLMAWLFGWGVDVAVALSSVFIGYGPSFVGTITGSVWAFVLGLISGVLIAWFYNKFANRRRRTI